MATKTKSYQLVIDEEDERLAQIELDTLFRFNNERGRTHIGGTRVA